ncbi:hypothetical protein HKCCE2091_11315 [Rhodobacterales bacterium HKCCE2091]|nr:hypothetical protein [Rhodobacterales bacterium HKCCE2091]
MFNMPSQSEIDAVIVRAHQERAKFVREGVASFGRAIARMIRTRPTAARRA